MNTGTLPTYDQVAAEFDELSSQIHDRWIGDADSYYGQKDRETLFLTTGKRDISSLEFERILSLVKEYDLPLTATCHAKFGGFFFILSNPKNSDKPEILFGFEVRQVPTEFRLVLRARYASTQNRKLLGAYMIGERIDRLLPYLDTSHSAAWEE